MGGKVEGAAGLLHGACIPAQEQARSAPTHGSSRRPRTCVRNGALRHLSQLLRLAQLLAALAHVLLQQAHLREWRGHRTQRQWGHSGLSHLGWQPAVKALPCRAASML